MINTRMSSREILNEFWKDYKDTVRPRILSWISANKKSIIRSPEKFKDSNGFVILHDPRQIKTATGNTYRSKLKVKITKSYIEFITTTYTTILDSTTGKNRIIVLPSSENYNYLIILDSHVLQRYNALVLKHYDLDFKTLTDEFIRADNEFTLQYDKEFVSKLANSYIEFGNNNYGIAIYSPDTFTVEIKTFLLGSDIETWRNELGMTKESNPLEVYISHKEKNKVFSSIVYPDLENEKARQMREAWEEYERKK